MHSITSTRHRKPRPDLEVNRVYFHTLNLTSKPAHQLDLAAPPQRSPRCWCGAVIFNNHHCAAGHLVTR